MTVRPDLSFSIAVIVDAGDSKAGTIYFIPFDCSSNHDEKMVKVSKSYAP